MSNNGKIFGNEKVSASAGSGKTFALTTRFIGIAATPTENGATDPFSIIALTFTKKAAGEFLAKILQRLARAANSDAAAAELAAQIGDSLPDVGSADFPRERFESLLRQCAENLDKLRLGTIDSLFASIITQNANALRIFGKTEIVDENSFGARHFTLSAITDMMDEYAVSDADVNRLAEMVKAAQFGRDEKRLKDSLAKIIETAHKQYLAHRDLSVWGNAELSGVKLPQTKWNVARYRELFGEVSAQLGSTPEFEKLLKFFGESDGAILSREGGVLLERMLEAKRNGELAHMREIPHRKTSLELPCAPLIDEMLDMLFDAHFKTLCAAAKALGLIASLYELRYDKFVRSRGNITFSDMPYILTDPSRATDREIIEYKLDAKLKHWLFDEFQDTSQVQWEALGNLVGEAIVDPQKSFYYVGDIKQSIYSWRGATPELFNKIFRHYNANAEVIRAAKPLMKSYRSGGYVIDAVNAVFGSQSELARVFGDAPAKTFGADFTPHISAERDPTSGKTPRPSYAQLSLYDANINDEADTLAVCEKILKILKTVRPLERKISCAVLMYKNSQIKTVVNFLKEHGLAAVGELSENIAKDRPAVSLFTAILRGIAHPLNTASAAFCDCADISDFTESFSPEFCSRAAAEIYAEGFEKFADKYIAYMRKKIGDDARAGGEFERLKDACAAADAAAVYSLDEAAERIADASVKTSADASVIQVMTVHKSKGLAFAITIVPVKNKPKPRSALTFVGKTILPRPDAKLAAMNPTLFAAYDKFAQNENFEALCKYYVSMTRAERALYVLAPKTKTFKPETDPQREISFAQHLLNAFVPEIKNAENKKAAAAAFSAFDELGATAKIGDEFWFNASIPQPAEQSAPRPAPFDCPAAEIPQSISAPSAENAREKSDARNADFGTKIHACLERIKSLKNRPTFDAPTEAIVQKLAQNADFAAFFDNPEDSFAANEFAFECSIDGAHFSGAMDRITAAKRNGKFESANIIDYKPTAKNAEKYAKQLNIYARAAAEIFSIEPEKISAYVVGYLDAQVASIPANALNTAAQNNRI